MACAQTRIVRMNKRLKKEIDQNVAERHGWKWAATSFMNENWSCEREELLRVDRHMV